MTAITFEHVLAEVQQFRSEINEITKKINGNVNKAVESVLNSFADSEDDREQRARERAQEKDQIQGSSCCQTVRVDWGIKRQSLSATM